MLHSVARVIVGEGLSKALCPGEERCSKFYTAVDKEDVCRKCPNNLAKSKLSDIEGSNIVLPWLGHVLYIYGLKQVGAVFHINDLTKAEWDGILLIEGVKSEIERERLEKEELKRKVDSAAKGSRKRGR